MFSSIKVSVLSVLALVAMMPATSYAVSITASELLTDPAPYDISSRDLTRTLQDSNGFFFVENNDANIIASNNVDSDFGIVNNGDVSYTHNLTWLSPAATNFTNATLTILAWGNIGGDDVLFGDTFNFGKLTNGSFPLLFSTSTFTNNNPVFLNATFADGLFNVVIDKNSGGGFANLNLFSVYSSKLEVTYDAVPEPASLFLLGSGLLGLAGYRRRA